MRDTRIDFAIRESAWTQELQDRLAPLAEWHCINARRVVVNSWCQIALICAESDLAAVKALLPASVRVIGEWQSNGYRRQGVSIDKVEWAKTARDRVVTPGTDTTPPVVRRPDASEWEPEHTWLGWGMPRDEEET